jgi:hypothetical protein
MWFELPPTPLFNILKAKTSSTCYIERRKTKIKVIKVANIAVLTMFQLEPIPTILKNHGNLKYSCSYDYPEAGFSYNYCATNSSSPEVDLRFCQ